MKKALLLCSIIFLFTSMALAEDVAAARDGHDAARGFRHAWSGIHEDAVDARLAELDGRLHAARAGADDGYFRVHDVSHVGLV